MIRIISVIIALFLSSNLFAKTLPFNAIFYDPLVGNNYEGVNFSVANGSGSQYLYFHTVLPVLLENPYLYNPNFEVGVIDFGIFSEHEDFHRFLSLLTDENQSDIPNHSHGTLISSILSVSTVANSLGTHGFVNTKTNFMSYQGIADDVAVNYLIDNSNSKIINLSFALDYCGSYEAFKDSQNGQNIEESGCETISSYGDEQINQHILNVQEVRNIIKNNPDRLFFVSGGNSAVDSIMANGALHYTFDNNGVRYLDKIGNLIVSGAIYIDKDLTLYSNYGESIDLVTLGESYGAFEIEGEIHKYAIKSGTSYSSPISGGGNAVLLSADFSMTPNQLKTLILDSTVQRATHRKNPFLLRFELEHFIPIMDLQSSYTTLKNRLQIETYQDISALNGVEITASNDVQCINVWNAGGSPRTVVGSGKSYEAKFYGDRCLYFRGNSYVIDFDLTTKTATRHTFEGYGQNKFREYMTFRNFVNNLNTANTDNDWRTNYGLMQNSFGHVSCSTVDTCVTNTFTTVEECKNLFKALTGDNPVVMGSAQTTLKSQNVCVYSTDKVVVEYDANVGEVKVSKKSIQVMTTQEAVVYLQSKVNYYRQVWISNGKPNIYYLNNQGDYVQFNSKGYPINFYTSVDNKLQSFVIFYLPYLIDKKSLSRYIEKYDDTSSSQVIAYFTSRGTVYIIE